MHAPGDMRYGPQNHHCGKGECNTFGAVAQSQGVPQCNQRRENQSYLQAPSYPASREKQPSERVNEREDENRWRQQSKNWGRVTPLCSKDYRNEVMRKKGDGKGDGNGKCQALPLPRTGPKESCQDCRQSKR